LLFGVISGVSSRKLSWKVVGLDMFVICYLFCGWCFGGLFDSRMLTHFNKVKINVGIKFVMVPKWYMIPKGNTFRIFHYFVHSSSLDLPHPFV
jgi:hypothetical protein